MDKFLHVSAWPSGGDVKVNRSTAGQRARVIAADFSINVNALMLAQELMYNVHNS